MKQWRGLGTVEPDDDRDLEPLRPAESASSSPSAWRTIAEIPLLLVVAAVIALAVKTFLAQAFFIPSASMEPQLTAGDRVVVSRLAYDLHEPRRGDIVVFDDPLQVDDGDESVLPLRLGREALEALGLVEPGDKELIKRVIALPGERIMADEGDVYIDDRLLIEPYLDDSVITSDFGPYIVPDGHVFMMGDNRTNSKDSRVFDAGRPGAIPIDSIVGRAIGRVWPPGRIAFL